MSSCNTSTAIHCFPLPKPLKIHHQLNSSNQGTGLRQGNTRIRCCYAKRSGEATTTPKNYYQILGVSVHSTTREIREAYRKLQKKHHPDVAGPEGHEYTLMLNEAYQALMRYGVDVSSGRNRGKSGSNIPGLGYSSWRGPLRPQALFVDENKCIGCQECAHHANETFVMDDVLGCARVRVQFGDQQEKLEVAVDSCPVNCIHWVESEELPLLEFLVRPQPKEANGIFGGGWARPADVFTAAKYFKKLKQEQQNQGKTDIEDETPAQAEARYRASLRLEMEKISRAWNWLKEQLGQRN